MTVSAPVRYFEGARVKWKETKTKELEMLVVSRPTSCDTVEGSSLHNKYSWQPSHACQASDTSIHMLTKQK